MLWNESARFALALSGVVVLQTRSRRNGGGKKLVASFGRKKRTALRAVRVADMSGVLCEKQLKGESPSTNLGGNV